ncbi:uncharacterized protein LOC110453253 isoform X2 [Mizuhopecten yessoensis]|uniref:Sterile alpha motif domain-containing protein 9-like n=1 Tax=Mizuhopecten yessoensis TaxID=6573 RepID=A0A210QHT1_MIZYE|nr:uncharacterized protein LOC110453253 isoform X2 [Mizuhopecten yessoensis]XP_021357811.1 uncharacterized protein LOC110453253 isoform X2 [Mizuhopecten yessoensis]XP_021357812.1 uncharacterized protein LOC110453253 isoform X2 [Mizuhopecten yessoensis]XP_021357813.1 uncharacterized protein LOC110453253 isoform X2 [Mizuhopecten yessoensis]OWF48302.1 Sterile alpha motif domain-containing protein 9-like [Mizuhopecten yessoensis]
MTQNSVWCSKANRWLSYLTKELGGNFAEFASHIGFTESQVKVIQETGQHLHQLVISKWLDTIGRHTTKHQHVVYTALMTLKRQDLLDKHFKGGPPEKYSDDIWEDFIKELHAIEFNNEESSEPGQDKKPDVTKKKKKNSKRTRKKSGDGNEQKEKVKEKDNGKLLLEDDTTLPSNPQIVPSAGNKQKEKVKEKVKERDRERVILADDTSLPDNPQIVPSAGNEQKEKIKEKVKERDRENMFSVDDTSLPGNVSAADTEQHKTDSVSIVASDDNVTNIEHVGMPALTEKQKQHVVIISKDSPVIVGDHTTVVYSSPGRGDEGEESIRKKLYDIMETKGAVGRNAKKNKMNLQTLESCFHRRNGKHFESMYGKALLTYLHQSTDYFTLTKQSGLWFAHVEEKLKNTSQECTQTHEAGEVSKVNRMKSSNKRSKKTETNTTSSIPTFTRPTHDHTKTKTYIQNKCTQFGDFLDFVGHFRDENYLLLISKTDFIKHEEALSHIPWLCVFDFDANSFTEGLYFRNEALFRENRAVYPCTWFDPPSIQTFGTEWCFISGSTHRPGSSTPECFKKWYKHIQGAFEKHIKDINKLLDTVKQLTVIAFWPRDQDTSKKFQKIISVLHESVQPFPQVVVVSDNPTQENITHIDFIEPDYHLKEKLEHVFHDLAAKVGQKRNPKQSTYRLPTASGSCATSIDSTQAASFRESMQVLYLDNPCQTDLPDLFASEEQEKLFFRGGNLSWEAYYNNSPEHFYVPRDILPLIVDDIRSAFIDGMKSGEITIFHAPGAGGTTLGQNILWQLHALTPCVQVRSDTLVTPKQAANHITKLYQATHLPILVLFDELNDTTFENIRGKLKDICVIFLNLKRVSVIERKLKKHEYFLSGALSANEAKRMGPKFTRCCEGDSEKKDQIQKLVDDIVAGHKHHLIEFGLVTYLHEFIGVAAYVSEYLKLDEQNKELEKSRRVLGYLSLVQFFGQGIMPCQLFGTMLGKSLEFTFRYDNFPPTVKEFTVPVESDFTRNSVRICHYLIAKEILDQVLSKAPTTDKGQDLSELAKQNLQSFVLKFIEDLKIRQEQLGNMSRTVFDIILQIFIYRENHSTHSQQREIRTKFSRLIESIPSEQPFTERLQVMETLAESFPGSPSLWAHFGRALTILRPTEREKTETYFQKAISGCNEGKNLTIMDDDESDTVLSYVYHMYGIFYLKQIRTDIAQYVSSSEMQFQHTVSKIIFLATTACESFENSRKLRYAGFQESLGCFGMIDVRLAICEFIKRHYRFVTIKDLLNMSQNSEMTSFVEKSLSLIQQLFMQCYNVVDRSEIGDNFYKKITLYNSLFKGMVSNTYMDMITVPESVDTRGVVVAAIKLKYGEDDRLGTVEDITDETDIKRVISLLEQNFDDIKKLGVLHSKTGIDHDFLDWIHAIRLVNQRKLYAVEDVLVKVRFWFNSVRSPYSRLYLFILLFVYAFHPHGPCKRDILKEAIEIKEDTDWNPAAQTLSNPKRPREWLSKELGVRCLLPGSQKNIIDDEDAKYHLLVLKGTIRPPNTYRNDGIIDMDIKGNINVPVVVHFSPIRTKGKLVGLSHAGRRVEFMLAFTPLSGLEAYNVTELKKSSCKTCGSKVEIVSVEKSNTCKCGEVVENEFPIS